MSENEKKAQTESGTVAKGAIDETELKAVSGGCGGGIPTQCRPDKVYHNGHIRL